METNTWLQMVAGLATQTGMKILGAIALWIIGRWLVRLAVRLLSRAMQRGGVDATLIGYVRSSCTATLNVVLVVAILGFFGVETTSFAALFAAIGVAIGMAWSGLLSNFAAGVFLVLLRPFKVGDFVTAGGITGTVSEIGLLVTVINSPDNVRNIVGNSKIFGDTIQNFSFNPYRRVDLTAQLDHSVDHRAAIQMLTARIAAIPNVVRDPAPDVEILSFNLAGPVLAVRPYCGNADYWQVYFDTNRVIRESFGEAAFPVPEYHYAIRTDRPAAAPTVRSATAA
ncbi:MAG: mechanosensitive ion channel family protein [Bryobacterales bacterium]|nr:mechanosensitive ion channel family protein [Bryobacterales bacterium]